MERKQARDEWTLSLPREARAVLACGHARSTQRERAAEILKLGHR